MEVPMCLLTVSSSGRQAGTTSTSPTRAPSSAPQFFTSSAVATRADSNVTAIRSLMDRPGRSTASASVGWSAYMCVPAGMKSSAAASWMTSAL
jgi:hypothetical protein